MIKFWRNSKLTTWVMALVFFVCLFFKKRTIIMDKHMVRDSVSQPRFLVFIFFFQKFRNYHFVDWPYLCVLQSLEDEVRAHHPEFEHMRETAQDISRSTGDGRTASYAGQLFSRYQTLADAVKVRRCTINCNFCHLQISFTNSLDPDQDRQNVGPDLNPNCLTLW